MTNKDSIALSPISSPLLRVDEGKGVKSSRSFMVGTLMGVATVLQHHLGLDHKVEFSVSDFIKQQWAANNMKTYPRSYLAIRSLRINRTTNGFATRRHGLTEIGNEGATGNYLDEIKAWPVTYNLEFNYFESDMDRAMRLVEDLAILNASGSLAIELMFGEKFKTMTRLEFEEDITLPELNLSDDQNPASCQITTTLTINSYVGLFDKVARAVEVVGDEERGAKVNINVSGNFDSRQLRRN